MKVLITGGHHTSALPVIKELKKQGAEIFWVGHRYPPLEYKEITGMGIPFFELKAGKVYKNLNPFKLFRVFSGFMRAFSIVVKVKPDVILSFGGYLAAPVVFSGWLVGVPSITHEQTSVVGYANKFISRFAKKILISWKQSEKFFPKEKVVYSGLPLRGEIFEVRSNSFSVNPDLPTIYVTAGKTGSQLVNHMVFQAASEILEFANVIHQTGDHQIELIKNTENKPGKYFVRNFVEENEIGEVMKKSSMIVGRAGAHTVSEIIALKKPALLIPISWVSHNEQFLNAKIVKDFGLAEILEERYLSKDSLLDELKDMLENISKYVPAGSNPAGFVVADAVRIITDELFAATKAKTVTG